MPRLEGTGHGPVGAVADWLRANGIDPIDVPVDSRISIEPGVSADDRRIRYTDLLRNELGHLRHDPATDRGCRSPSPTALGRSASDHADASAV
ncbi:hypothetical protein AB0912_33850 [Streptomyces sp. NPDC007084]|uniref:hypothetical protein n=1 Tax=Streptomyces sp. NPDC007084 TaxID=3154313 RepID=UPI00345473D0